MPGIIDLNGDQDGDGSGNGQGTAPSEDRTAEDSAEQSESLSPLEPELDIEKTDPFPTDELPPILRNQVRAIAELGDWPESLVGPLVLAAASACLGRAVCVRSLKGNITYGNIFVLVAKQSGAGGSTAFRYAMRPLHGCQALNRREHETLVKPRLEAKRIVIEQQIENLRNSLRTSSAKKAEKKVIISEEEREKTSGQIGDLRSELVEIERDLAGPLFMVGDCTSEGLAKLLANHGGALAHFDADAGDALGSILGKYQEREKTSQSIWLKGYSCEDIVIGRKKEGLLVVESPCLCACFIATPDRVRELFGNSQLSETGLLPRFLTVNTHITIKKIPPSEANIVRKLPADASQPYEAALFECLRVYRLKSTDLNRDIDMVPDDCQDREIDMTPAARLHLLEYFNDIADQTQGRPDFFIARYIEQAAKLSLLHHIYSHIEIEQRGAATYGVKSLTGHNTDLDLPSAQAGVVLQKWFVRRQAEFLGQKRMVDEEMVYDKFFNRIKSRPHFTVRELYLNASMLKSEAQAFFARWQADGRIEPIASKDPQGRGRPPTLQRYRFPQIFRKL